MPNVVPNETHLGSKGRVTTNSVASNQLRSFVALVIDTLQEAMARRMIWGVYGASVAILLFLAFILEIDLVLGAKSTINLFGQEAMGTEDLERLNTFISLVQGAIAAFLYAVSVFVAIFLGAGLSSTILERGRLDALLARPIPRAQLLLARYTGILLIACTNVVLLIVASWLILGWKSEFWNTGFLSAIPITCFMIASLLSLVMLVVVLTGNGAIAMIASFVVIVFSPILAQNELAIRLLPSGFARGVWHTLYLLTPKVFELGSLLVGRIGGSTTFQWQPVLSSALFAAIALALALWRFSKTDR